jgi:hypothetical protein
VLCASTLLLYQYQAPEPIRTKPNKPLVTSITSLVVGIFIVRQHQHRSSRRPEPDGVHNRSNDRLRNFQEVRLKEFGSILVAPERRSPEYLQKFIQSKIEKWAPLIKMANIKAE